MDDPNEFTIIERPLFKDANEYDVTIHFTTLKPEHVDAAREFFYSLYTPAKDTTP